MLLMGTQAGSFSLDDLKYRYVYDIRVNTLGFGAYKIILNYKIHSRCKIKSPEIQVIASLGGF